MSLERGYAFVEIPSQPEGKDVIVALNDKTLRQMTINVIETIPLSGKKSNGSYIAKRSDWVNSRVR